MNHSKIEKINGKYLNLKINNQNSRIFFEENGNGIPLICLHTAGSDSRQFRHLLNSKEITKKFTGMIAGNVRIRINQIK